VKNRDVLISTIAATLAGAITYLAHMAQFAAMFGGRSRDDEEGGSNPIAMILLAILARSAALLVQMAVSRSRSFRPDATGAKVAGRPWGLMKALEKLQMANQAVPMANATPATAHLFIVESAERPDADASVLDSPAPRGAHRPPAGDADLARLLAIDARRGRPRRAVVFRPCPPCRCA